MWRTHKKSNQTDKICDIFPILLFIIKLNKSTYIAIKKLKQKQNKNLITFIQVTHKITNK